MEEPSDFTTGSERRPRYAAEDISATTKKELWGWYAYGLAAEIFAVCGVGSFAPVTLEQLARERGVFFHDRTKSCVSTAPTSSSNDDAKSPAPGFLFRRAAAESAADKGQCVIQLFGKEITTSSFAMYTFSIAVFVQAIVLVSFSGFADFGNYRKKLLLAFGFAGATASMLFLLVVPQIYVVGAILVVVAVTCLGSSFVVLNSYLPLLARNYEDVQGQDTGSGAGNGHLALQSSGNAVSSIGASFSDASNGPYVRSKSEEKNLREIEISTKISSKGVGIGYMAAVTAQILSILLLVVMKKFTTSSSTTLPLRLILFMVGLYWFVFNIPAMVWLRPRPGPPLPVGTFALHRGIRSYLSYVSFAWRSLFQTIKLALRLRQTVLFLIAWFIVSDAIATVSGTAILFARTELQLSTVAIACLSITASGSGILGAFSWPLIQRRYHLRTNTTIVVCLCLMETIPIYGLLAYIPFIHYWGVIGLQQSWEIFPLAALYGFSMGGFSSYCRSLFGLLIPPRHEAAFYALFAVTDKGSSAIGPAVVGLIVDRVGTIRPAFWFLLVLIALPVPLIWAVDAEKGRADAVRMSEMLADGKGENFDLRAGGEDEMEGEGLLREERGHD